LFKLWPQPPFDNVADLKKDPLVMWQHRHIHSLAVLVGFGLPALAGFSLGRLGSARSGGSDQSCVAKIVVRMPLTKR